MFYIFVMARQVSRLGTVATRNWQQVQNMLVAETQSHGRISLGPFTQMVPESKQSVFGDHGSLLLFMKEADALAADKAIGEVMSAQRLEREWDLRWRGFRGIDGIDDEMLSPGSSLYEVSWRVPSDIEQSFHKWYRGHLRWHAETFGASQARLLNAIGSHDHSRRYPFETVALYWFDSDAVVAGMCENLVQRAALGWPDVAQWNAHTLSDRSAFTSRVLH